MAWKCCVCKKPFESRIPLTQHIVEHFQSKILDSYVESGTKCKICKYHDANTIQLTRHVALQHEKIREFIPTDEGDALFITEHQENNSSPKDPKNPMSKNLECYLCHKSHKSRSELRQHIFCHLKQEIQSKFYGEEPIKSCTECSYKSIQLEHILMHLALKHQKITEFVPKEVIQMIYKDKSIKVKKSGEKFVKWPWFLILSYFSRMRK